MPQWLVIGISGVTCGGKTTLAHGLRDYFKGLRNAQWGTGNREMTWDQYSIDWNTPYTIGEVKLISQDDYFLPVDDRRHKRVEKLNAINFELISALDMKKMLADIAQIINGNLEQRFADFKHYASQYQQQHQQQQQQKQQLYNSSYYQLHSIGKHMPATAYQYQPQQQQQRHHHHHQQQQQPHHLPQQHRQHLPPQQQQQQHADHLMRLNINAQIAAQVRDKKVNVLLIEGFMIFNQPELLALCNLKYHFHLPYEKCYERRIKRTYDPPDVTGYFELCVWPYYEKNFAEYRDCKDITFLNGEIGKEKIFKFVLQRIVRYFEERCDVPTVPTPVACPPQQKRVGMLYMANAASNNNHMPTACPMEQ